MIVSYTAKSQNVKLGPIPAVMSPKQSCPSSCPLQNNGCYANSGAMNVHWDRVSGGQGIAFEDMCAKIAQLPPYTLWRYATAGDLPGYNESIDQGLLTMLVRANAGRRGFTFTHKHNLASNHKDIARANEHGFTVNLSANNLRHADILSNLKIGPVVTLLPSDAPLRSKTPEGRDVVACPAQTREDVTCARCKMCADPHRKTIIGFLAHGSGRGGGGKKVSEIARGKS